MVFQRNGRVHLNWQGGQFIRLLAAEVCASAVVTVVILGTPCSEVQCYPLHSHVFPSLPLPWVTVCHQVSTELYHIQPPNTISTTSSHRTPSVPYPATENHQCHIQSPNIITTISIQQTPLLPYSHQAPSLPYPATEYDPTSDPSLPVLSNLYLSLGRSGRLAFIHLQETSIFVNLMCG